MRVSVVIPTYNSARFLATAIRSVLAQTYKEYEIIVVDDGSSDNTTEVIKKFGEVCTYIWQRNAGTAAARNNGIAASRGHLIAFLDADDAWLPGKLEAQVRLFEEKPEVGLVETASYLCDEDLNPIRYLPPARLRGDVFEDMLVNGKGLVCSSVVVRRSLLERVGGFNTSFRFIEDREMWLRLAKHCDFDFLEEAYVYYRVHPGNKLTHGRMILCEHSGILEQHLPHRQDLVDRTNEILRRHVEFAIKVMCLGHQWRDALSSTVFYMKTYPFRDSWRPLVWLPALAIPKKLLYSFRKLYWRFKSG